MTTHYGLVCSCSICEGADVDEYPHGVAHERLALHIVRVSQRNASAIGSPSTIVAVPVTIGPVPQASGVIA